MKQKFPFGAIVEFSVPLPQKIGADPAQTANQDLPIKLAPTPHIFYVQGRRQVKQSGVDSMGRVRRGVSPSRSGLGSGAWSGDTI